MKAFGTAVMLLSLISSAQANGFTSVKRDAFAVSHAFLMSEINDGQAQADANSRKPATAGPYCPRCGSDKTARASSRATSIGDQVT